MEEAPIRRKMLGSCDCDHCRWQADTEAAHVLVEQLIAPQHGGWREGSRLLRKMTWRFAMWSCSMSRATAVNVRLNFRFLADGQTASVSGATGKRSRMLSIYSNHEVC